MIANFHHATPCPSPSIVLHCYNNVDYVVAARSMLEACLPRRNLPPTVESRTRRTRVSGGQLRAIIKHTETCLQVVHYQRQQLLRQDILHTTEHAPLPTRLLSPRSLIPHRASPHLHLHHRALRAAIKALQTEALRDQCIHQRLTLRLRKTQKGDLQ